MTRVTNFGRKRTYLEAGFHTQDAQAPDQLHDLGDGSKAAILKPTADPGANSEYAVDSTSEPPRNRAKRGSKSKKTHPDQRDGSKAGEEAGETQKHSDVTSSAKKSRGLDRKKKVIGASEARRLKRMKRNLSDTTCFACREKGHAAKDCPKVMDGEDKDDQKTSRGSIGICYRCGSQRHSLSRCKKPSNVDDPFPFASCFVCNGKGHLASSCPQNKGKGIYPNGGCCKLCGETTHLARNCTMRQKANDSTLVIGTAHGAGADEDDFHIFKRTTIELDRAERRIENVKKMLEVKKGVVSGAVVRLGNVPLPSSEKKVVVFK